MKKSKFILKILLVLGVCILLSGGYCAWVIHTSSYTIPFELITDKIFLKAKLDGKEVYFIYDTGGYYSLITRSYLIQGKYQNPWSENIYWEEMNLKMPLFSVI